jgi:hypothetical protein
MKNILICLLFIICSSCKNENENNESNNNENLEKVKETEVLDFIHLNKGPHTWARLTGEYMSKLDLSKFTKVTVKIHNETGLTPKDKDTIIDFIAYGPIKGYQEDERMNGHNIRVYGFTDLSGYCVAMVAPNDNVYSQKPKCTYQIISTKRYVYENEKDLFSSIYPEDLLILCK